MCGGQLKASIPKVSSGFELICEKNVVELCLAHLQNYSSGIVKAFVARIFDKSLCSISMLRLQINKTPNTQHKSK